VTPIYTTRDPGMQLFAAKTSHIVSYLTGTIGTCLSAMVHLLQSQCTSLVVLFQDSRLYAAFFQVVGLSTCTIFF
jgi:hypothetical protein